MKVLDRIGDPLASDILAVRDVARESATRALLVGGPVRDAILGRPVTDLDFLVERDAERIARDVAARLHGKVRVHPSFLTATVTDRSGRTIDFTTARTEIYDRPGALPTVLPSTIERDLFRRDFTINAIAWDPADSSLLDPHGGVPDLDAGLVRILHPDSFLDDPTRMFRAIRFSVRLGFRIEPGTQTAMEQALQKDALQTVSTDRIFREMLLSIEEESAPAILDALVTRGPLSRWLGSASSHRRVGESLSFLRELIAGDEKLDREVLYLAALFDAVPGANPPELPLARRRLELLSTLRTETDELATAWQGLSSDRDRAAFCLDHPPERMLFLALKMRDRTLASTCRGIREQPLPFRGDELGVPPGPHVGRALKEARVKAWLDDPDEAELLAFARETAVRYLRERT